MKLSNTGQYIFNYITNIYLYIIKRSMRYTICIQKENITNVILRDADVHLFECYIYNRCLLDVNKINIDVNGALQNNKPHTFILKHRFGAQTTSERL